MEGKAKNVFQIKTKIVPFVIYPYYRIFVMDREIQTLYAGTSRP